MFFRSREAQTIEAVRAKLAEAETEEAAADQALKGAALAAALSPDPFAAEPQREALRRAREKVELLRHAVVAAEDAERQAVAAAKAKLRASQNRSIRQHVALLCKAAARYQAAQEAAVAAYREMVRSGEDIKKLLPIEFHAFAAAVSIPAIEKACLAELARVGAEHPSRTDKSIPTAPGAEWYGHDVPTLAGSVKDLPPLPDRLKARLVGHYQHLVGAAPPPVAEPEPRRRSPRLPPPALPAIAEPELISPAESTSAVAPSFAAEPVAIDLDKIHPAGSEERAGFEQELERWRRGSPAELVDIGDTEPDPVEADMVPIELARLRYDPFEVAHTGGADPIEVVHTGGADPTTELAEDNPTETSGDLIETDTAPIEDTPAVLADLPALVEPTPSMSLRRALAGLGRNR